MKESNIYLKYLTRSHTLIGVFIVFIFYISTFFGTITLLKPYLNSWQNSSRHFEIPKDSFIDLNKAVAVGLQELNYPSDKVHITLPSFKENALTIKYGFSENIYINPYTTKVLNTQHESDFLTNFFNQMHVSMQIPKIGQVIMGLASIAIIFLTMSGFYLWLKKRKQRDNTKSSFWFKWHKNLSLIILPYIIVFSLTGAVLGVMLLSSSPFAYSATDGKENNMSKLVRPIIFPSHGKIKKSGIDATMLPITSLYQEAKKSYPNLHITKFTLYKWGDKNGQIVFSGFLDENRILSARVNRITISLSGTTGEVIKKNSLKDTHVISQVMSAFYFFHFLTDEELFIRILFFLFGIAFAASLVFGIFIYLEKKILKNKMDKNYFQLISRFTTALTIGVIPASAFLLFLYWLIPFETVDRDTWLKGSFFTFWSFSFFYSVYKEDNISIVKFFINLSGVFLLLATFLHQLRTQSFLWDSFQKGLDSIFWIDIICIVIGVLFLALSKNIEKFRFLDRFRGI